MPSIQRTRWLISNRLINRRFNFCSRGAARRIIENDKSRRIPCATVSPYATVAVVFNDNRAAAISRATGEILFLQSRPLSFQAFFETLSVNWQSVPRDFWMIDERALGRLYFYKKAFAFFNLNTASLL